MVVGIHKRMKRSFFTILIMSCLVVLGLSKDRTPPSIVFEVPVDGGFVEPDRRGIVYIRAKVMDDRGIRSVMLMVPHSHAIMSPTNKPKWTWIQLGWDTREDSPGIYQAVCMVTDTSGNSTRKAITMNLRSRKGTK